MKKIICLILVGILIMSAAVAEEIDLSGLSLRELEALRNRCLLEMFSREDWQEVSVPQGVYQAGVHIPAGTWTVQCKNGYFTTVEWGEKLESNGQEIDVTKRSDYQTIYNPEHKRTEASDRISYTFTVRSGDYIIIDHAPAVFTPGAMALPFSFK